MYTCIVITSMVAIKIMTLLLVDLAVILVYLIHYIDHIPVCVCSHVGAVPWDLYHSSVTGRPGSVDASLVTRERGAMTARLVTTASRSVLRVAVTLQGLSLTSVIQTPGDVSVVLTANVSARSVLFHIKYRNTKLIQHIQHKNIF